jgi:hypothetical protein
MPNSFYNKTFDVTPGNLIGSQNLENQFLLVEQGFDLASAQLLLKSNAAGQTYTGTHNFSGATVTLPPMTVANSGSAIRQTATATGGQTVFTLSPAYIPGANNLLVYINGVRQHPGTYTETNSTTVTFSDPLTAGDSVLFETGTITFGSSAVASLTSFTPTPSIPQTNVQDALANLKVGISSVSAAVTDSTTLTAASAQYQFVQMAGIGRAITLPDATTIELGGPRYNIDNSAGGYPVGIRDNAGKLIMAVAAGGSALVSLRDKTTAAGVWSVTGTNLEPGFITIDALFPNANTPAVTQFTTMSDSVTVHYVSLAGGSAGCAAFVADAVGRVVSTPVTITTTAGEYVNEAFRIDATRLMVFYGSGTNTARCVVLTVTGASPTLSLSVGTPQNIAVGLATAGAILGGAGIAPNVTQLSTGVFFLAYYSTTALMAQAITVSGTAITIGSTANIYTANLLDGNNQAVLRLTDTTALVLYATNPGSNLGTAVVVTVAGTTCTIGTPVVPSFAQMGANAQLAYVQLSATKVLIAANQNGSNGNAYALTIAGTTITVGTLLTFASGVGININYSSDSANRVIPHMWRISDTSAGIWWKHTGNTESGAVILTESGGTLTAGTRQFRIIGTTATSGSDVGFILPPSAMEFVTLRANGVTSAWGKRLIANKISGTSIVSGASDYRADTLSFNTTPTQIAAAKLSNGTYILLGAGDSKGAAVFSSNGDYIDYAGVVSMPSLATLPSSTDYKVGTTNRIVILGEQFDAGNAAGARQLRLISMEIAA